MMQTTNQRQPSYTSWTNWPPAAQNPTGSFACIADTYPRTYSTTVFATPIKHTAVESQTTALFPMSGCPPVSPLRKTCYDNRDLASSRKPNCSYTVLIGMALKASKSGTLPVSEIYQYIQQEFPFFKAGGPGGWKNSVRHSLSLGQYFRKVVRKDGYQGKKGFHWEVVPEKKAALDKEVERFMNEEGFVKIEMTAARATTFKSAAAVLPNKPVQSLPAEPEMILHPPMESPLSKEQPDLSSSPVHASVSSAESFGVTGAFSDFSAQISSSLEQLLSTLGSLDVTFLQKLPLSDIQTLMFIVNKNLSAVTTADTPSLEPNSNPQPTSAVVEHITNEPLPSLAGAELAPTLMVVPSDLQLSASTAPILPSPFQDPLPNEMTPTAAVAPSEPELTSFAPMLSTPCQDLLPMQLNSSEHSIPQVNLESISEDFLQPSMSTQPCVAEYLSDLPILQPDPEMLKEIGLPSTDIVSFADTLLSTSNSLYDNCTPTSQSGVLLPEDANNTVATGDVEEQLNRQKSDYIQCEVDRGIELYCSTHPAPQQSATISDIDASTDNYYTLDSRIGMGDIRPPGDLDSLAVTGCVQKSTIHVDVGHLNSQSPFIDPTHPSANITLTELNQEPAMSLDPHHSGTFPYDTWPSFLDDVDGTTHSDSFTRAMAPVCGDWDYWNDPEYSARLLQLDLDDFDEVVREVTFAHEQEDREEEERKKRLCLEETHSTHGDFGTNSPVYYQRAHTGGKWSPSCSDWNELVGNGEHDTPKSALKHDETKVPRGKKRSRKRMLDDRDDIRGVPGPEEVQLKKKRKYIPAVFSVFMNSDESETDLD